MLRKPKLVAVAKPISNRHSWHAGGAVLDVFLPGFFQQDVVDTQHHILGRLAIVTDRLLRIKRAFVNLKSLFKNLWKQWVLSPSLGRAINQSKRVVFHFLKRGLPGVAQAHNLLDPAFIELNKIQRTLLDLMNIRFSIRALSTAYNK